MRPPTLLLLAVTACGCGAHADSARVPQPARADSGAVADASPLISDVVTPANTLAEVLQQVQTERDGLHAALTAGATGEVRDHAAAIGELVQAIPVMTPSVPLKRARHLDALVEQVEQHAGTIQQSDGANGVPELESTLDEIVRVCAETGDGD